MSIEFDITCNEKIPYPKIYESFPDFKVKLAFKIEQDMLLEKNKFLIPEQSARGIYVRYEESTPNNEKGLSNKIMKMFRKDKKSTKYNIKINSFSSPEDFLLALKLVQSIARITGSEIKTEYEKHPLTLDEFNKIYNDNWIEENKTHGVNALLHLIFKEKGTITIEGCRRNYYIGEKVLARFSGILDNEKLLYHNIIENIKELQFFDASVYNIPGLFEETSENKTFLIIFPNKKFFLYKVDFILLSISESQIYRIPYEKIEKFNNDKFRLIDEYQYFIEPLTEEEIIKIGEDNK